MFATDPTLYGATFPQRELPYVNPAIVPWAMYGRFPFYGQQFPMYGQQQLPIWGQQFPMYGQQLPWYGQQIPWYGQKYLPMQHELYPQFQSFYGNRFFEQPFQGYTNVPQYKWQVPFTG